jgi:inorganic phosphate transporter, PiT family
MAFAHGTGDAQKAMGLISGALVAGGFYQLGANGELPIPWWNRLACALTMGFGSAVGGWAVMRTLGSRIIDLRPYQGFAAETAAATTILANTLVGVPISTTHSITGAIMGVGAAQGARNVRWGIGKKIVYAWVFTFPACIAGGWLIATGFRMVGLK